MAAWLLMTGCSALPVLVFQHPRSLLSTTDMKFVALAWAVFAPLVLAAPHDEPHNEKRQFFNSFFGRDATFDYVIVGGGTAGLVMANRLSAQKGITVAVIEGGSLYQVTNPLIGNTPAGDTLFSGSSPSDTNPLVDWDFVTQPQAGANNRRIHYARGKCLGGRSVVSIPSLGKLVADPSPARPGTT